MPFKANAERHNHIPKQRRRVTISAAYDTALRQRGNLTVWFTDAAMRLGQLNREPLEAVSRAIRDCVAQVIGGPQFGHLVSWLREADVFRTSEFEHLVHCVYGNRDLGRSTPIGARSQPITDDSFETADVSFH